MRKLLFIIFLEIPGTVLHIGGILLYLVATTGYLLKPEGITILDVLILSGLPLIFLIGRAMVVGSELLTGKLALPERGNLFAIATLLEVLAQGASVTACAFLAACVPRFILQRYHEIAIFMGIAALSFAAMWSFHLCSKWCMAKARTKQAAEETIPTIPED